MPLPMTRIILYVRDVALLKAFYQRYFALPVIEEIDVEWVVLDAGAIALALHRAGPAFRDAAAFANTNAYATTSNVKLVFRIDADLDAHRNRLARDGVTVRDPKRYDGFPFRMYDGVDPEGNVFQVMQPD
ncbi:MULTISPECIES: VOC family protein [Burkholderia]|uniref:VOC family protein n=1 Tax=Burkholderia TaxID=32008 RepID=UPI001C0A9064|nr:lactoylglutathione lyase [Burkholderia cenocepacia]CAG2323601.1 lactoylglutathione lyase [Burkholderia cenocepacia]CAG2323647.1 lactoylglutathione lyase [Burkholderia cenocepacia]CAG2323655.1 lactoylglutathione lyase [Burkholderia cenocepacia]CAG2323693.1 lactoylglutathione lyase [Burkholderia cenocepacia]